MQRRRGRSGVKPALTTKAPSGALAARMPWSCAADGADCIKAEPGPDVIVWGGGRLAGALAAADLRDEYRLLVQLLVLGQGRALFDQLPDARHMNLVDALSFPSGIVVHIYRPQHA